MTQISPRLILGSSSPQRLELLAQIGIIPDLAKGADIDETPLKGELPDKYALRVALEKNVALQNEFPNDFILTSDTTGAVGRRIIGKPDTRDEAKKMFQLLSGRSHNVHTAVILKTPEGKTLQRLSTSRLKLKRLTDQEIEWLLDKNEWQNTATGCRLLRSTQRFVISVQGTPSSIIGLPLYETMQMLNGSGYKTDTPAV